MSTTFTYQHPPKTFRVTGSLRHHFHGSYSATIAISCGDTPPAQIAAQLPAYAKAKVAGDLILIRSLDEADEFQLLKWLAARRVDGRCMLFDCGPRGGHPNGQPRHPIDSTAHSIDHGPTFTLELPFVDLLTPLLPFKESAR